MLTEEKDEPKYDYIENNKHDYGKQPKRGYGDLHNIHKEEKERAHELYIQVYYYTTLRKIAIWM